MRYLPTLLAASLSLAPLAAQNDWPVYGHDAWGQRFSPLTQVNRETVKNLKLAWQYDIKQGTALAFVPASEVTPIVVDGLLYYPTLDRKVVALEPETGKEVWSFDLGAPAPRRGVTYWPGDANNAARIIAGTGDGRMVALNAKTGMLIPSFGNEIGRAHV